MFSIKMNSAFKYHHSPEEIRNVAYQFIKLARVTSTKTGAKGRDYF